MKHFRLAAVAMAASICPLVQAAPGQSTSTPQQVSSALSLAEQIAPHEPIIEAKLREFDRNFGPSLLLNEDIRALEAEFPGSVMAMASAGRPLLAAQTAKVVGQVHRELADFLNLEFSSVELADLSRFYSSPHGSSMVRLMADSIDQSATYRSMAETGSVSREALNTQRESAIKSTLSKLSDDETTALLTFAQTPTFAKLRQARPKIREMISKTLAAPDPEYDKQVETAIDIALEAHIASLKSKDDR